MEEKEKVEKKEEEETSPYKVIYFEIVQMFCRRQQSVI